MPLGTFLRYISDKANVSVAAEAALDDRLVTLDVQDEPVSAVLGVVARRLGVQVTRAGHMFFLGSLRPEDKGVLVRKVTRLGKDDLEAAVQTLLSEHGKVSAYDDGLVVVGDRVEVLQRVAELLDGVEVAPCESWVVQMYLVSVENSEDAELGLDIVPLLDLSYTLAQASANPVGTALSATKQLKLDAGLSAVLKATRDNKHVHMVAQPLFLLVDGQNASISKGKQVPIVRKATSPEGTVSTLDVQYKQTGLQIDVTIRDMGDGRARCGVKLDLSDIVGTVNDAPVTANQSFQTSAVLTSGGVYLLGSLGRQDASDAVSGPLQADLAKSKSSELLQIWCRAYRVMAPSLQK